MKNIFERGVAGESFQQLKILAAPAERGPKCSCQQGAELGLLPSSDLAAQPPNHVIRVSSIVMPRGGVGPTYPTSTAGKGLGQLSCSHTLRAPLLMSLTSVSSSIVLPRQGVGSTLSTVAK